MDSEPGLGTKGDGHVSPSDVERGGGCAGGVGGKRHDLVGLAGRGADVWCVVIFFLKEFFF